MSRSRHTEAQMIAALKQVEAGRASRLLLPGSPSFDVIQLTALLDVP